MRQFLAITCVCLALACPATTLAADAGKSLTRLEQRQLYRDAINHIKNGRTTRAQQIKPDLVDYPLYPYVEYTEKIYNLSRQSPDSILAFVTQYQDSPLADQLLANWLYVLARQGNWPLFLEHYRLDLAGERNACHHAFALYKTGQKDEAWAAARNLWRAGHSRPEECDPVFKVWREAGGLDAGIAWERFSLTLKANEVSLASYLMRYLAPDDKALANNFKLVQQNAATLKRTQLFRADSEKVREVILYGLRRLASRDSMAALTLLDSYAKSHGFTPAQLNDAYANIGFRIALDGDPGGVLDSIPVNPRENPQLVEARIRLALRRQDLSTAFILMNLLPEEAQQTPRWQYWKARALSRSQDAGDLASARELFTGVAHLRNFYGFLAADILGTEYQFEDAPAVVGPEEIERITALPAVQRAEELFILKDTHRARQEWQAATRNLSDHELQVAARVAATWGWHRESIMAMVNAGAWNDLAVRFPVAYHDNFVANALAFDVPLTFSIAVARQESAFMPDAKSSAGALGIMQLMPATAKETANRNGLGAATSADLVEPPINIKLGSAYLSQMLRRFDNNRVLASAAYNAGPGRVDRWLDPSLPLDVWVETIPFSETRDYVQNVLMFSTIYSRRFAEPQPLIFAHELRQFSNQQVTVIPPPPETPPDKT